MESIWIVTIEARLDNQEFNPERYNLIIVGLPCNNNFIPRYLGYDSCKEWPYEEGNAIIKLVPNGDKIAMVITGTTELDLRRAASVLMFFDEYRLSGREVCVRTDEFRERIVESGPCPLEKEIPRNLTRTN